MRIKSLRKAVASLLIGLAALSVTNCKKSEIDPADLAATCKLSEVDRGNGTRQQYEYNADGYVSKWTINFTESAEKHTFVYLFGYNNRHQITGAKITIDGKSPDEISKWSIGNKIECSWTNGKLTQVRDMVDEDVYFTTSLTYDASGRITRLLCEPADRSQTSFEKTYTYDADENFKYYYLDDGVKLDYDDITVDKTSQSAESLLANRGLPFDFFNLIPWRTYNLKKYDSYYFDKTGKPVLARSYQITNLVKNKHNIVTSQTVEEGGNKRVNTFSLMDCD
ncbi:hypothetical protein [Larkinella terrae]|uniref:DUF4595 domain-containing protein n=1 Tax=Larkinella terrae TaxID=2025311 RepID=A0A7K0EPV3_9BACT|nr:hypothetical protein [Larkinella terrae]MRS63839.1 hypothetical protein [Larkinella terrae]